MTALEIIKSRLLDQQRNGGSEQTIRVLNEVREAVQAVQERGSYNTVHSWHLSDSDYAVALTDELSREIICGTPFGQPIQLPFKRQ